MLTKHLLDTEELNFRIRLSEERLLEKYFQMPAVFQDPCAQ